MSDVTFVALPLLKSKMQRDIPVHISQKLNYQWKVLHKNSVYSPQFKLGISHSFMATIEEFSVELPPAISEKFCPFCSAFLGFPSAVQIRIRPVRKNSKLNRRRAVDTRGKNDLVITCLTCCKVAYRVPAFGRRKEEKKSAAPDFSMHSVSVTTTDSSLKSKAISNAKRFSFLDKLDDTKNSALGGLDSSGYISFTEFERKGTGAGLQNLLDKSSKKRPFDILSLHTDVQSKVTTGARTGEVASAVSMGKVNLDALEQKYKKQKKKGSVGLLGLNGPATSISLKSGPTLSSLQSMFSASGKK